MPNLWSDHPAGSNHPGRTAAVPLPLSPSQASAGTGAERPAGSRLRVAVQQRQRLYRVGLCQLLAAEDDLEVVVMATTGRELLDGCRDHRPDTVLLEGEPGDPELLRTVAGLRRGRPEVTVIGLTVSTVTPQQLAWARRSGMRALVPRREGMGGILAALRAGSDTAASRRPLPLCQGRPTSSATVLTERELEVLGLVGAGLTSAAVAHQLRISPKTVENHKQRIFAKLGVQSQAHAVSVAMRTGLMRPEPVVNLAVRT